MYGLCSISSIHSLYIILSVGKNPPTDARRVCPFSIFLLNGCYANFVSYSNTWCARKPICRRKKSVITYSQLTFLFLCQRLIFAAQKTHGIMIRNLLCKTLLRSRLDLLIVTKSTLSTTNNRFDLNVRKNGLKIPIRISFSTLLSF